MDLATGNTHSLSTKLGTIMVSMEKQQNSLASVPTQVYKFSHREKEKLY